MVSAVVHMIVGADMRWLNDRITHAAEMGGSYYKWYWLKPCNLHHLHIWSSAPQNCPFL